MFTFRPSHLTLVIVDIVDGGSGTRRRAIAGRLIGAGMTRPSRLIAALLAGVLAALVLGTPASATPPGIPSKATAQSQLNALTVATEGSTSGYCRDLFPHWITIIRHLQHPRDRPQARRHQRRHRQLRLRRHLRQLVLARTTAPPGPPPPTSTSTTSCRSPRPGAPAPAPGPPPSGSSFANDLTRPQLIAVTDNVNQSKGDQDPSTWLPSRTAYRCTYAKMWITVKYYWGLTLQSAEKSALQTMLNTCSS